MHLDPCTLSTMLGIVRPTGKTVTFPPANLDKAAISKVFGRESMTWFGKLQAIECLLEVRLLNLIFTYNHFPTTYNNDMPNMMVHAIYSLLTQKEVDVAAILYHIIITKAHNSSTSWLIPYGVMITHLSEVYGVSFPKDATTLR